MSKGPFTLNAAWRITRHSSCLNGIVNKYASWCVQCERSLYKYTIKNFVGMMRDAPWRVQCEWTLNHQTKSILLPMANDKNPAAMGCTPMGRFPLAEAQPRLVLQLQGGLLAELSAIPRCMLPTKVLACTDKFDFNLRLCRFGILDPGGGDDTWSHGTGSPHCFGIVHDSCILRSATWCWLTSSFSANCDTTDEIPNFVCRSYCPKIHLLAETTCVYVCLLELSVWVSTFIIYLDGVIVRLCTLVSVFIIH
jgi:hypothetical protein